MVVSEPKLTKRITLLSLGIVTLLGCSQNDDSDNNTPPQVTLYSGPDTTMTVISAMQEPRITLNNPWSNATADYENAWWCLDAICGVWTYLSHEGTRFTTWKSDYEEKLAECQSYAGQTVNGENICVPTNNTTTSCAVTSMLEYGYYCGAGRPASGFWNKEPLDGVDYCCYLHDRRIWDTRNAPTNIAIERNLACGVVMCLYNQTEFPAGASSAFPEVESARQCLHDWAAYGCTYNQSNNAPPPTVQINP